MPISESELPGVGTKFEIDIGAGQQLVIIVLNNGRREVYLRTDADADSEKLMELSDQTARKVGSILEGAHFQPIATENAETFLTDDSTLEWFTVDPNSDIGGTTLGEAKVGERTGVSVLVVKKESETIASPTAETEIEAGDTLVVLGSQAELDQFEELSSADTGE